MSVHYFLRRFFRYIKGLYFDYRLTKSAIKAGKELDLDRNGFVFQSDTMHSRIYVPLYKTDQLQKKIVSSGTYYERSELDYVFNIAVGGAISTIVKDHCVLDIGTNIGNHTLYFLFECGAGKVHCFEPIQSTYLILHKNIEINSAQDRVVLHHVGVGAKSSLASIANFSEKSIGSTELSYSEDGDIPIVAIDDLKLDEMIAFVKIDVEGFEYEVIKGMMQTLKKYRPYIMIEAREEFFDDIVRDLAPLGYWYLRLGKGINYLFISKENNIKR